MSKRVLLASVITAVCVTACAGKEVYQAPAVAELKVPAADNSVVFEDAHPLPPGPAADVELERAEVEVAAPAARNTEGRSVYIAVDGNQAPVLHVADGFDNVWEDVLTVAAREYGITDRDRSRGLLYLDVYDSADGRKVKRSFFNRKPAGQIRLMVSDSSDDIQISVQSDDDLLADSKTSERILGVFRDALRGPSE